MGLADGFNPIQAVDVYGIISGLIVIFSTMIYFVWQDNNLLVMGFQYALIYHWLAWWPVLITYLILKFDTKGSPRLRYNQLNFYKAVIFSVPNSGGGGNWSSLVHACRNYLNISEGISSSSLGPLILVTYTLYSLVITIF